MNTFDSIIIIQEKIPHYRVSFFNELNKIKPVTVIVFDNKHPMRDVDFKVIHLIGYKFLGFFIVKGLYGAITSYRKPVIFGAANPRHLISIIISLIPQFRRRWIWWGAELRGNRFATFIFRILLRGSAAIIFYNDKFRDDFITKGFDKRKLFVANNTIHHAESEDLSSGHKKYFLNVGSLHNRKRNDLLLQSYEILRNTSNIKNKLVFVGDGEGRPELEEILRMKRLERDVKLIGQVEDEEVLKRYYQGAIASVSYAQAGLAVLQSMAYGVPYITKSNALSGGEIFNIKHGENGLLVEGGVNEFAVAMGSLANDDTYRANLGRSAYECYQSSCRVEGMVNGFMQAVESLSVEG